MLKGRAEYIATYPAVRIINLRADTGLHELRKISIQYNVRSIAAIIIINAECQRHSFTVRVIVLASGASPPRNRSRLTTQIGYLDTPLIIITWKHEPCARLLCVTCAITIIVASLARSRQAAKSKRHTLRRCQPPFRSLLSFIRSMQQRDFLSSFLVHASRAFCHRPCALREKRFV